MTVTISFNDLFSSSESGVFADGDLITIFDSADLSFAIQCSRILKLQLLLGKDTQGGSKSIRILKPSDLSEIKVQLRSIRNQVNKLLDTLDTNQVPDHQTELQESKCNYIFCLSCITCSVDCWACSWGPWTKAQFKSLQMAINPESCQYIYNVTHILQTICFKSRK